MAVGGIDILEPIGVDIEESRPKADIGACQSTDTTRQADILKKQTTGVAIEAKAFSFEVRHPEVRQAIAVGIGGIDSHAAVWSARKTE